MVKRSLRKRIGPRRKKYKHQSIGEFPVKVLGTTMETNKDKPAMMIEGYQVFQEDQGTHVMVKQEPVDPNTEQTKANGEENTNSDDVRAVLTQILNSRKDKELSVKTVVEDLVKKNALILAQNDAKAFKPLHRRPPLKSKAADSTNDLVGNVLQPRDPTSSCSSDDVAYANINEAIVETNAHEPTDSSFDPDLVCAIGSKVQLKTQQGQTLQIDLTYYWCNFCNYKSDKKDILLQHMLEHRFHCKYCKFQSFSRASVIRHCVEHHEDFKDVSPTLKYCTYLPDILQRTELKQKKRKREAEDEEDDDIELLDEMIEEEETAKKPRYEEEELGSLSMEVEEVGESGEVSTTSIDKIIIPRTAKKIQPAPVKPQTVQSTPPAQTVSPSVRVASTPHRPVTQVRSISSPSVSSNTVSMQEPSSSGSLPVISNVYSGAIAVERAEKQQLVALQVPSTNNSNPAVGTGAIQKPPAKSSKAPEYTVVIKKPPTEPSIPAADTMAIQKPQAMPGKPAETVTIQRPPAKSAADKMSVASGLCWNCGYCDFITLSQSFLKIHLNGIHQGKPHKYVALLVSSAEELARIKIADSKLLPIVSKQDEPKSTPVDQAPIAKSKEPESTPLPTAIIVPISTSSTTQTSSTTTNQTSSTTAKQISTTTTNQTSSTTANQTSSTTANQTSSTTTNQTSSTTANQTSSTTANQTSTTATNQTSTTTTVPKKSPIVIEADKETEEEKKIPVSYKCAHCNFSGPDEDKVITHLKSRHMGCVMYVLDMKAVKLRKKRYLFFCLKNGCGLKTKEADEFIEHIENCTPVSPSGQSSPNMDTLALKSLKLTKQFIAKTSAQPQSKDFKTDKAAEYGCLYCSYISNNNTRLKKHVISNHQTMPTAINNMSSDVTEGRTIVKFCHHCLWETRVENELEKHLAKQHNDLQTKDKNNVTVNTSSTPKDKPGTSNVSNVDKIAQKSREKSQTPSASEDDSSNLSASSTASDKKQSSVDSDANLSDFENSEEDKYIEVIGKASYDKVLSLYIASEEIAEKRGRGRPARYAAVKATIKNKIKKLPTLYRCFHCENYLAFGIKLIKSHIKGAHKGLPFQTYDRLKLEKNKNQAMVYICPHEKFPDSCMFNAHFVTDIVNHASKNHGMQPTHPDLLLLSGSTSPAPSIKATRGRRPATAATGESYECLYCETSSLYYSRLDMKKHLMKSHPEEEFLFRDCIARKLSQQSRYFMCHSLTCDFTCPEQKDYKLHLLAHRKSTIYECSKCPWFTSDSPAMKAHGVSDHNGEEIPLVAIELDLDSTGKLLKLVGGTVIKTENH